MSKRFKSVKLLPVWIAVSAVFIIAGIVLFCLFGFNFQSENPNSVTFEVSYDAVVLVTENGEEDLQKLCEDNFSNNGLTFAKKQTYELTNGGVIEYTFRASDKNGQAELVRKLGTVKTAVDAVVQDENGAFADADLAVSVHSFSVSSFTEAQWRGAVAIATGAIVALIYLAVRFGIGPALTGLTGCVDNVLVTLAILVIARVPVYAYSPLVYSAIAAFSFLTLWVIECAKMRENFKDSAYAGLSAEEAVGLSAGTALKTVLCTAGVIALFVVFFGAIAVKGVMLFVLPALIPVALSLFTSLLFAPSLHVYVKRGFDAAKAKRKRYQGKKKAEKVSEE